MILIKQKKFYSRLGFKIEYERNDERFVFMSFQGSQFYVWTNSWWWVEHRRLSYPLGRGINFSIAVEDVEGIYKLVKTLNFEIYRELTRNQYQVNGAEETQIEFLIQDPNGYLLRFTNW